MKGVVVGEGGWAMFLVSERIKGGRFVFIVESGCTVELVLFTYELDFFSYVMTKSIATFKFTFLK